MDPARRGAVARYGADRLLITASLVLLTLLAWVYLWLLAAAMERGDMSLMGGESMAMPMDPLMYMPPARWTAATVVLTAAMWWTMMFGMMIPSSMPAILLYARVQRHHLPAAAALRFTALFAAGYLAAWGAFSAAATVAQWGLNASGILAPMTLAVNAAAGAVLFAAAGIYQLSPLKGVCLRHCRSPAEFLAAHRRPGAAGAFVTGAHHGLFCVGCCWLLMALLFAGGVMNLLWVAALAGLVLLEKLVPHGHWLARASGVAMLGIAGYLAVSG